MMASYVVPMLVRRRTRRYRPIADGRFVKKFKQQFMIPGFGRALLSLFRNGALGCQLAEYRSYGERQIRTALILRGSIDSVVKPGQIDQICEVLPGTPKHELEGLAHSFLLTDPGRVAPILIDFLQG